VSVASASTPAHTESAMAKRKTLIGIVGDPRVPSARVMADDAVYVVALDSLTPEEVDDLVMLLLQAKRFVQERPVFDAEADTAAATPTGRLRIVTGETPTAVDVCRCGHERQAHEQLPPDRPLRAGDVGPFDCIYCECSKFTLNR